MGDLFLVIIFVKRSMVRWCEFEYIVAASSPKEMDEGSTSVVCVIR